MITNKDLTSLTGLASYLCEDKLIDYITLKEAVNMASQQKISLVSYLVTANILSSDLILKCCQKHFKLPVYDLRKYDAHTLLQSVVSLDFVYKYRVIPLSRTEDYIHLGIADPTDHTAINAICFHTGLAVHLHLVNEDDLSKLIQTFCQTNNLYSELSITVKKLSSINEIDAQQESKESTDQIIVTFVDQLIHEAYIKKISDIHIEPYENYCRIRFRRDGLLYEAARIPSHIAVQVITRLKLLAHLNIAEKRLPQDGRLQLSEKNKMDVRINACPTLFGEKIVLRLLDTGQTNLNIHTLGFNAEQKTMLLNELAKPQGLFIVTGPTGSGKTITLYAAISHLNQIEKNIISIEDPVEIQLEGINQVNVNPKIGFDFANALRAFLRQDPDIIMIGEMRDTETATIALQAALTGHFVLATLHTNTAKEAVLRLKSMGLPDYDLNHFLSLIISQRLVRKLCAYCKKQDKHNSTFVAIGCRHCHQGYHGRIGIFELLPHAEKAEGLPGLWEAGLEKMNAGLTSYAELQRVIGSKR